LWKSKALPPLGSPLEDFKAGLGAVFIRRLPLLPGLSAWSYPRLVIVSLNLTLLTKIAHRLKFDTFPGWFMPRFNTVSYPEENFLHQREIKKLTDGDEFHR